MIGDSVNFDNKYNNTLPIWGKSNLDIELKRYLKLLNGKNVLDLGIGEGQNSIVLSELGYNVTGIDCSSKSLEICKSNSNNIELVNSDIRNYNIEKNKYDLIISRCVLHFLHKNDINEIIKNIKLNLKSSGLVYISVFSTDDPSLKSKFNNTNFDALENNIFYNKTNNSYVSYFTKNELLKLLSDFSTILISDEYSMDLNHGDSHYHGIIKYIGQKK